MQALRDLLFSLFCSLTLHGIVLIGVPAGIRTDASDLLRRSPVYARLSMRSGEVMPIPETPAVDDEIATVPVSSENEVGVRDSVKTLDGVGRRPMIARPIDDYLPISMLDLPPRFLADVDTVVDFRGMEGVVGEAEILLLISSAGQVDDVRVLSSSLPEFVVDAVVERFERVRFSPGELRGMQVRSRLRVRLAPPTADQMLGNPASAKERAWRR